MLLETRQERRGGERQEKEKFAQGMRPLPVEKGLLRGTRKVVEMIGHILRSPRMLKAAGGVVGREKERDTGMRNDERGRQFKNQTQVNPKC